MMTWDSPGSLEIDIVFGVLPALYLGVLSILGFLYAANLFFLPESKVWILELMALTGVGAISTYVMIYVTFARGKTTHKSIFIACLTMGIVVELVLIFAAKSFFEMSSPIPFKPALIAISIVAIKHIVMLTRA